MAVIALASVKIDGYSSLVAIEVDTTSKAARASLYKTDGNAVNINGDPAVPVAYAKPVYSTYGAYALAAKTAALTATAGATLFSARWESPDAVAIIYQIKVSGANTSGGGDTETTEFELIKATSFTVSDSGGTSLLPLGSNLINGIRRNSKFADIEIASAASGLTAGTRTVDAAALSRTPLARFQSAPSSFWSGINREIVLWDVRRGQYPIVLAENEGILIRNVQNMANTGVTDILSVTMIWAEAASY